MNIDYSFFKLKDGQSLAYKSWTDVERPKGIIILIHGMAEHIERYDSLATYFNTIGYLVYGSDQRGHGKTPGLQGYIHPKNGWEVLTKDQYEFYRFIKEKHPELDISYFAHSMGSFVFKNLIGSHDMNLNKVILSGSGYKSQTEGRLNLFIAKIVNLIKGGKREAIFFDKLVNDPFAASVESPISRFDWISRDKNEVAKYINDSKCGFICTNNFYLSLIKLVVEGGKKSKMNRIPKELPILLYSGDHDPVGGMGASEVKKYYKILKSLDKNVTLEINKGGRHESVNEINREEVFAICGDFLNSKL